MLSAERINELLKLDDEALVDAHDAAAIVGLKYETLNWYRKQRPSCGPKHRVVGRRTVRYRMGDLRAYLAGEG